MNDLSIKTYTIILLMLNLSLAQSDIPIGCLEIKKRNIIIPQQKVTIDGHDFNCFECTKKQTKSTVNGLLKSFETYKKCQAIDVSIQTMTHLDQSTQFDEADALFGQRTEVKGAHSSATTDTAHNSSQRPTSVDHRKTEIVKSKPERGTKGPMSHNIPAPSKINIYAVTSQQVTISWMDNANNEYGVAVERGKPEKDRGGINFNWQHVFNVEERIDTNIKGTGWRTDGDDGLSSGTKYCYRLRAYVKTDYSDYSSPVCITTL
ncbi:MAG: hypothetical protein ACSHWU_04270 [Marinicella sp.]